jgi:4-hydroxybenzoate polyprenyltransferase
MLQKSFISHILIIRPLNVLISGFSMILASRIINAGDSSNLAFLISGIVMLFTSGANVLNDYVDYKIDTINRPLRPIPRGFVKRETAFYMAMFFFIFGCLLCMKLNKEAEFIGLFIAMPIMVLYTSYLKKLPIIGNFAVAITISLSFLFCGAAHGSINPMKVPMILCFFLSFLRELIKDMSDIKGDKASGMKTFPIYFGMVNSAKVVIIFSIFSAIIFLLPFIYGVYSIYYLIFLFLGVEIPLGIIVFSMKTNPGIRSSKAAAKLLKISTLAGLIAIYTGTTL